jgi:putative flippase GtrA
MVNPMDFRRFRRFLAIGGLGFFVDLIVFECGWRAGLPITVARVISFAWAVAFTFLFNRSYTYARRDGSIGEQFIKYVIASGMGAAINLATFFILILLVPVMTRMPSIVLVSASLAGLGANFALYSIYVF